MAVKMNYNIETFGHQLEFPEAYFEVVNVTGDKAGMIARVVIYDSAVKTFEISAEAHSFVPDLTENAPNSFRQAYEHIKTLAAYANAVNC